MPRWTGSAAGMDAQYDPEVPVIMVTAIHDISTALEAIRRGAYDYILKPFGRPALFGRWTALQHRV